MGFSLDALDDALVVNPDGLTTAEAQARLARVGPNSAVDAGRRRLWRQVAGRFANPLVLILLLASVLSAAGGDVSSFVVIIVIVLASVVLDVVQEARAENAVAALRRSVALKARVRRDGREAEVPAEDLVPGDVVRLSAGDLVPADGRLIEARDLFLNQALLTGEPYPVEKHARDGDGPAGEAAASAVDAVFMGTSVISGSAIVVITRTGKGTLFGGIAGSITGEPPPSAFEVGVRRFGLLLLRVTVFLVLFVVLANVLFHRPWLESILFALALAVGLTPELLPMIVTVTLARGAMRLARRRVIVKRLAAMHNLGAMEVLCTDKTGTLTEARIRLVRHLDAAGVDSDRVFQLAYLNSVFESGIKSPLDTAIIEHRSLDVGGWRKLDEVPFDFERRRVSVLVEGGGGRLLVVKGAPEDILARTTHVETAPGVVRELETAARAELMRRFEALGEEGFRVLGIAWRVVPPDHATAEVGDEADLVFSGFACFLDPPKAGAAEAFRRLAEAGIAVRILTGDNERVTRHVCAELGVPVHGVITGDQLAALPDEALAARLDRVTLFCRVTPQQKRHVLLAFKHAGTAVGFLGDGINDAAALRVADVGISVDSAVDVAKEAADLILLDHDLAVIHEAVIEGRRTVLNVTKYILMGASSNFGNMLSMAAASLLLPFLPMRPIQVLLNNLLYDASEIGIPFDHVDAEALARPVRWDLGLIQRFMLVLGPVSSLFDFLTFAALLQLFHANEALFQTGWFVESLATQVLVIFVIRTRRPAFTSRPHPLLAGLALGTVAVAVTVPLTPLGDWFGFVTPPAVYYVFLAVAVAGYLILTEVIKDAFYRRFT